MYNVVCTVDATIYVYHNTSGEDGAEGNRGNKKNKRKVEPNAFSTFARLRMYFKAV